MLSHQERPQSFIIDTGGYERVQGKRSDEVDILTVGGQIDRFRIIPTTSSILPANPQKSQFTLSTPKLGLLLVGTIDATGKPLDDQSPAPASPVTVSSKLISNKHGLKGQMTASGFYLLECVISDAQVLDLRGGKIVLGFDSIELSDRLTAVDPIKGQFAAAEGRKIYIRDMTNTKVPIIVEMELVNEPSCVTWIDTNKLISFGNGSIYILDVAAAIQGASQSQIEFSLGASVKGETLGLAKCPLGTSIVSLSTITSSSDNVLVTLARYSLARQAITSGPSGKLAILENAGQLLHLRISAGLFSAKASEDDSTAINIRDNSFLWEFIDVPESFLNGSLNVPLKRVVVHQDGRWIAVAGRYGLCLCHLAGRHWRFFDEGEERKIQVEHMSWIDCIGYDEPLLAILGTINNDRHEFWILSPAIDLSIGKLLHQQTVEKHVLYMNACGDGLLGILSDDFVLQVVKLSMKDGALRLSIMISAALASFAPSALDRAAWKVHFIPELRWNDRAVNLFIVQRGDLIFTVDVPPQEESDHTNIAATMIQSRQVDDFFIWQPIGQLWLVVISGRRISAHKWPFKATADFTISLVGEVSSFYPNIAGGLMVVLEHHSHIGWQERDLQKIGISQTLSLLPAFLASELSVLCDVEFSQVVNKLFKEFGEHRAMEFRLIIELLFLEILNNNDKATQVLEYERIERVIRSVLGPRLYRECVVSFMRRIEISDAKRILHILGPYSKLFPAALSSRQVDVAWSLLRIHGADDAQSDMGGGDLQSLLRIAYEEREPLVFRGLLRLCRDREYRISEEVKMEISKRIFLLRDWTFLEILKGEEILDVVSIEPVPLNDMVACMMMTSDYDMESIKALLDDPKEQGENRSSVASTLANSGAVDEAALWSLIVDGDSHYLFEVLSSSSCQYSLDELRAVLNK
jgi:hypothetical protein